MIELTEIAHACSHNNTYQNNKALRIHGIYALFCNSWRCVDNRISQIVSKNSDCYLL
jgi:hypothetical protein